jgi:hypothetical protein
MRCAVPIGIARLPSGSRSLRAINTDPLFAVALLRRQGAAPSSAAMMRTAPKPVGVNHLRAFGFGHYLSCISELVSGVAGTPRFRELSWSHGTTQNQSPGAPSTWAVVILRGKEVDRLGTVEAPDQREAYQLAIEQFNVPVERQNRLFVRRLH